RRSSSLFVGTSFASLAPLLLLSPQSHSTLREPFLRALPRPGISLFSHGLIQRENENANLHFR
ncbi:MAG: hypothetical protein Q4B48_04530, partial [Syntrophomonadaceae bacterium]|nr:hypothetical protein [Syntrophomonadaceae bacterium]